jgi:uncharacterized membrane protein
MKRITAYFFSGILFLAPIAVTIYLLYLGFTKVDQIFKFDIPGLGFLLTLAIILAAGFLVSTFLARGATNLVDGLFLRMPLVKMIYASVKDLVGAFVGEKKQFDKPVLVTIFPGSGVQMMGFVTQESLGGLGMAESVAVFVPQSYNFGGIVIVVPRVQVTPLKVESGELMAFLLSGGVSSI